MPTYPQAPAPMGVADFGLTNRSGTTVATVLDTTSLKATFSTNSTVGLEPEYLDDGAPDAFGIQLNAVLTNVTLNGSTQSYGVPNQFWTQNVVQYAAQLHELQFIDNVWSFWPGFNSDTFLRYGPNGTFVDPEFYYAVGPTITIAYPFTLTLYLNSTVLEGNNELFFNYTLSNSTMVRSGSYDYVVFHSDGAASAGSAEYQANGFQYDPVGLPNDFEFVLGGPGGGSTTDFVAADASMALEYWNGTSRAYRSVPSAYNTGGETGETSTGAAVWYSGQTAVVTTGPSLTGGLWNASGIPGGRAGAGLVHLQIEPTNAFLFLGPASGGGSLLAPSPGWQWAPLMGSSEQNAGWLSGAIALAPGTYTAVVLESDYDPVLRTLSVDLGPAWLNVTLIRNASEGIYTPLYAWSNAQLPAIASGGAGVPSDPYRLVDNSGPGQSLNPLFGGFNDYGYPTFAGLELLGTTASVTASPPSFTAPAPSWLVPTAELLDVPDVLGLATWIVDAQHVAIVNATFTGIWFAYSLGGVDASDVMVFQSADLLVANNTFEISGGTGLFVYDQGSYGASSTTIWGNTFRSNDSVVFFPSCYGYCEGLELPDVGLQLMTDGALVYNNAFWLLDGNAAWTPTTDWWSLVYAPPVIYSDRWNITPQPAANVAYAGGFPWFPLTGSILGTGPQAGNFWQVYGTPGDPFGDLPFNNHGNITVGGDYAPLLPSPLFNVTVTIRVAPNDPWIVEVSSGPGYGVVANGTNNATISMELPNGNYSITGYIVEPGTRQESAGAPIAYGSFSVDGAPANGTIVFPPDYLVVFQPYGYEWNDTPWGICLNAPFTYRQPSPWTFSGGTLSAALTNGTWNYTSYVIDFSSYTITGPGCASVPKLDVTVAQPVGTITVAGADEIIPVEFNETFRVSVYAPGVPSDDEWFLNESPYPLAEGWGGGPTVLHLINGSYRRAFASAEPSLLPFDAGPWGNVSFTVHGAPLNVSLTFRGGLAVRFVAVGLPSEQGILFHVELRATNYSSYLPAIDAYVPSGTFRYSAWADPGYRGMPYVPVRPSGLVTVRTRATTVYVVFLPAVPVTFVASGLPSGTPWKVMLDGVTYRGVAPEISTELINGTYLYSVGKVPGYRSSGQGVVFVHGAPVTVRITWTALRAPSSSVLPGVSIVGARVESPLAIPGVPRVPSGISSIPGGTSRTIASIVPESQRPRLSVAV